MGVYGGPSQAAYFRRTY